MTTRQQRFDHVTEERAELGLPPADWPTGPVAHHETVIAAVLAIQHQTPPRRNART